MSNRPCARCGGPLPERSRADRTTCSMRCHVAAWRASRRAESRASGAAAQSGQPEPSASVVVVTSPAMDDPEVSTQLALWLADVAVEAASRDQAA
jgi:hypothetical protein